MGSKSSQSSCGRNRILIHADICDKDNDTFAAWVTVCVAACIPGLESQACSQLWRTQGKIKVCWIYQNRNEL